MIQQNKANAINFLPSIEEVGGIAVTIAESVKPELTVQEQAFFVAGFQECIKWLLIKQQTTQN